MKIRPFKNVPSGKKTTKSEIDVAKCKEREESAWNTPEMSIGILRLEEQKLSSRVMENLSKEDQTRLLMIAELQELTAVGRAEHGDGDEEKEKK